MRSLASKPNVDTSDIDYPYGKLVDDTGIDDGTPVSEEVYGDIHYAIGKLMDDANVVPSDLPENDTNGYQIIEALEKKIGLVIHNVFQWVDAGNPSLTTNAGSVSIGTGGVIYNKYNIVGKVFHWHLQLRRLTITGTPGLIDIDLPSTLVSAGYSFVDTGFYNRIQTCVIMNGNAVNNVGYVIIGAQKITLTLGLDPIAVFANETDGGFIGINLTAELTT